MLAVLASAWRPCSNGNGPAAPCCRSAALLSMQKSTQICALNAHQSVCHRLSPVQVAREGRATYAPAMASTSYTRRISCGLFGQRLLACFAVACTFLAQADFAQSAAAEPRILSSEVREDQRTVSTCLSASLVQLSNQGLLCDPAVLSSYVFV